MTEKKTRRTDYAGDVFGDWVVVDRATAENGKRRWNVTNTVTGETRIVLQTELANLPKEDAVAPVALVAVGSNLGWAENLATLKDEFAPDVPDDEDYHVGEAPEIEPNSVESVRAILGKFDGAPLHARDIAAKCIEAKDEFDSRRAVEAYTEGWAAELPVAVEVEGAKPVPQWTLAEGQVEKFGGVGEAAETSVSEAELDSRVVVDPDRAILRAIMSQIQAVRGRADDLADQAAELHMEADNLMALADQLLKSFILR